MQEIEFLNFVTEESASKLSYAEKVDISQVIKVRIKEIQEILAADSISRNVKAYRSNMVNADVIKRRSKLTPELIRLEKQLILLKVIKCADTPQQIWQIKLLDVIEESLGRNCVKQINQETRNRISGMEPKKLKFEVTGRNEADIAEIKRLTKVAEELKSKLIEARRAIDQYICYNEPEVNKGNFITSVSRINRCVPPETEIYKIKI